LDHRGFIELISVMMMMMMMMMRSRSSISFVRSCPNIIFLQSYFEGGGCRVIGAAANVRHQGCVGGVGDEIVAEQHYDLDAAANARNTCFPLAPASESEVHYSRVSFGVDCCSQLRKRHPSIMFCSIVKSLLFAVTFV
jgi:hypothetical protein